MAQSAPVARKHSTNEHRSSSATHAPPKSPVVGLPHQSPLESLATTPTHVQPPQDKKSELFQAEQRPQDTSEGAIAKTVLQQPLAQPQSPPAAIPQEPPKPLTPPPIETPPVAPLPASSDPSVKPVGKLPQVPPRIQSQGSINRGPPPAIPPRPQAILQRAGTVQTQSKPTLTRTTLTRQQSATSVAPQFTPQPPPKFVIPQRQNSRASLTRQQSNTSGGSPQSPKKH